MTEDLKHFESREIFREWLEQGAENNGVWLLFGKKGGPRTLTAGEALEEALCFGWIDGVMERIDDVRYRKYFAPRRPQSVWSEKNRKAVEKLEAQGRMTERGRAAIAEAKRRGTWESEKRYIPSDEDMRALADALTGHEPAHTNFLNMTASARKAYTGGYMTVKSEAAREKKLAELIERLNLNLNPMESLKKKKEELGL